ncbi:hypothetical protein MMC25_000096 [Agyrium rufum]|nr:hypothetical protein [Agyrium rufum]
MVNHVEQLIASSVAVTPTDTPALERFQTSHQDATEMGVRTLWVVFVIMTISSVAFYAMAYRVPVQKRLFHILTAFITTFAAISYFAMANKDGISYIVADVYSYNQTELGIPTTVTITVLREVYWARYVDWSVTTPLLLLDLSILAGLSGANILVAIVADLIMILTGLFAALTEDEATSWGYYAIACLAYLVIIYQLAVQGRSMAASKDAKTGTFFTAIGGFTLFLWTVYPIVWGLADGAKIAGVDAEIISYAVLDVLAKPVFGFWLLFTHDAMPSTSVSLEGFWSHGLSKEGGVRLDDDEGA